MRQPIEALSLLICPFDSVLWPDESVAVRSGDG